MILWDVKLYFHEYRGYAYLPEYEVPRLPTSVAFLRTSPSMYVWATTFARGTEGKIPIAIYRFCPPGSLEEQSARSQSQLYLLIIAFPREAPPLLSFSRHPSPPSPF